MSAELAGEYPRVRAHGHAAAFTRVIEDGRGLDPGLRSLAPGLAGWSG